MNIRAARWVMVLLGLLALAAAADSDYEEYEDGPAPAPVAPVKPLRPSPLLRQARGPVIGRPGPKSTVTQKPTTEAAPPPEYDDEEVDAGEEAAVEEEQPTTTTEAPKKGGLRTGMLRPFRSNADLIERLKKRRQQQQSGPSAASSTTTTQQPSSEKSFKNGRRGSTGNKINDQTGSNTEKKSTVNGRRFNGRTSKATEPPVEEAEPEEQPVRSRLTFGRNRRT